MLAKYARTHSRKKQSNSDALILHRKDSEAIWPVKLDVRVDSGYECTAGML